MRRRGLAHVNSLEYRADAGEQFTQMKLLCYIIISSEFEPDDPVDVVAAITRDDNNRHVGVRPLSKSSPSS
jgi:hypothetical protein